MPKFKVESQSKHAAQETYSRIKKFLSDDKDLRKMDASYDCKFDDAKMSGTAKGKQFEANMKVVAKSADSGAGSQVEIEVSLPMLLTPVKGMVQTTLQKKLDSTLA